MHSFSLSLSLSPSFQPSSLQHERLSALTAELTSLRHQAMWNEREGKIKRESIERETEVLRANLQRKEEVILATEAKVEDLQKSIQILKDESLSVVNELRAEMRSKDQVYAEYKTKQVRKCFWVLSSLYVYLYINISFPLFLFVALFSSLSYRSHVTLSRTISHAYITLFRLLSLSLSLSFSFSLCRTPRWVNSASNWRKPRVTRKNWTRNSEPVSWREKG